MRMLDLFCGRFGWSRAFAARGWECVGIDLVEPTEIPAGCKFIQYDIMNLQFTNYPVPHFSSAGDEPNPLWETTHFDFICASSPCQQFSTMRNFCKNPPYPSLGIKLFNHARGICEASGVPYIMENVAGAQKFVGKAVHRCGSYYLWGNGVPTLMHQGITKGMTELAMGLREHKGKSGWDARPGGKKGRTDAALMATIPPELANTVAEYAERILGERG